jgi:hypothetical protein
MHAIFLCLLPWCMVCAPADSGPLRPWHCQSTILSFQSILLSFVGVFRHAWAEESTFKTACRLLCRLNLAEGCFLSPLQSGSPGVNACAVSPAHGLFAAAGEGGLLECFDLRQRRCAGALDAAAAAGAVCARPGCPSFIPFVLSPAACAVVHATVNCMQPHYPQCDRCRHSCGDIRGIAVRMFVSEGSERGRLGGTSGAGVQ